jgi:homopolymeric O-antigen transport system permease protein
MKNKVSKANSSLTSPSSQVLFIRPPRGWVPLHLNELWAYRELLYFLVWRDVKVRYKQTALGITWAIIQPLLMTIVFTVSLGRVIKVSSDNIPYSIFVLSGLVPWQLFSYALSQSSSSLIEDERLIKKVFFPRLVIPISKALAGLIDFGLALLILIAVMVYYGVVPRLSIIGLPFFAALAVTAAVAVGLWLSALNALYRDVRYTLTFLIQFWLFATPVAYPSSIVPKSWRFIYGLNPMTGVVDGFRWSLFGEGGNLGAALIISVITTAVLLIGGFYFFKRMEDSFADVI